MPSGVPLIVSDVVLFPVRQSSQLDYTQGYLVYHQSVDVEWDDEACAGLFQYTPLSGEVLDAPARELATDKKNSDNDHVNRFVRSVPVKFRPAPRKSLDLACTAVGTKYGPFSSFCVL